MLASAHPSGTSFLQPAEKNAWARALEVPLEAIEIYLQSEIVDLHIDSFIWHRIFGYDIKKRHGQGFAKFWFMGQVDLPRLREAAIAGGIWAITTNPLRTAERRAEVFSDNLARLGQLLNSEADVLVVRNLPAYRAARAAGKHAALIGIQGGNALEVNIDALDRLVDDLVCQVTLVHLYSNRIGTTSTPTRRPDTGLSDFGREYVERLNDKRIFVDLAHISKKSFFDVVAVHDKTQPLIVTHTGIDMVHHHWRNLDDAQLKAIADTGGTIGVMYQRNFLAPGFKGAAESVARHLEHAINVVGEDFVSLGSDWDGAIVPPLDMPTCLELPRLVAAMLARGFSADRIHKIMGGNFLRALGLLRGE